MNATSVIVIVCALAIARYVIASCWARWTSSFQVVGGGRTDPVDPAGHRHRARRHALYVIWRNSLLNRTVDRLVRTGDRVKQLEARINFVEHFLASPSMRRSRTDFERYVIDQQGWGSSLGPGPEFLDEFEEFEVGPEISGEHHNRRKYRDLEDLQRVA